MTNQVSVEELKAMLVDKLNLKSVTADQIADDNALFGPEGLGLDSVDALELVLAIESEYGIQVQDEEVGREAFESVQVLCAFINERLAASDAASGDQTAPGA
jgi:acyl carrier protein